MKGIEIKAKILFFSPCGIFLFLFANWFKNKKKINRMKKEYEDLKISSETALEEAINIAIKS